MSHSSGNKVDAVAPHSKFYRGSFGRICPELEAWEPIGIPEHKLDRYLINFANKHMVELPGVEPGEIASDPDLVKELEETFGTGNSSDPTTGIPAGYTYFGQFIDHDITFDPTPLTARQIDPNGLLNFRTPRLDLDNIYGMGASDQPYLYDHQDQGKFLIGNINESGLKDLPRNIQGRALIGDMRNDENSMVSQFQLAFLLAHNTLVQRAKDKGLANPFSEARKTLQWLYQWIVWNDFVVRIAINEIHKCALSLEKVCGGGQFWSLGLSHVYKWKKQPFMPLEFSGAAFRFGHSMVRNSYQTNASFRGMGSFAPIFDNSGASKPDDLRGFKPLEKENAIQWNLFLKMKSSEDSSPQKARKIDTKLANALAFLHEGPVGDPLNILAFRNLKRGISYGLPSGSAMAEKYCIGLVELDEHEPEALWYYILKEAESLPGKNQGQMLGRLGSTIVCATIAGILKGDSRSFINVNPCWTPNDSSLLKPGIDNIDSGDAWELSSIIRLAGLPVDSSDLENQHQN